MHDDDAEELTNTTPVTHAECYHHRILVNTRCSTIEGAIETLTKQIDAVYKKVDSTDKKVVALTDKLDRGVWILVLILIGILLGRGLDVAAVIGGL
jgi:hypothetical protein